MISVLLNVLDTRASLLEFMKLVIEREVAQTSMLVLFFGCHLMLTRSANESQLFRSNSIYSRFLTAFARLHGYTYLRGLVRPLVDTMLQMPSGTSYEIDPNKCRGQDISENQKAVKYVAGKFIDIMIASYVALPLFVFLLCLVSA